MGKHSPDPVQSYCNDVRRVFSSSDFKSLISHVSRLITATIYGAMMLVI